MKNNLITILLLILISCKISYSAEVRLTSDEKKLLLKNEVISKEIIKGSTYEAKGLIKAEISEVYKNITAFKEYPSFMPKVSKVDILEKSDKDATLNFTLDLPLNKVKKYRVKMNYKIHPDHAKIIWEKIDWPGLKKSETIEDSKGYWILQNFPDKKGYTLVTYHVYTDPGHIPFGMGWIVDMLTKNSVPDVVKNLKEKVEK